VQINRGVKKNDLVTGVRLERRAMKIAVVRAKPLHLGVRKELRAACRGFGGERGTWREMSERI